MGYLICLFPLKSDLCRYFFQNVKKTDGGGKIINGRANYLFAQFHCEFKFTLL
jgi:hypothetical protein